ncbi:MAG: 50S ribosomal protein L19 [Verrucomicrobia bacterium]|nr:50S ribosomal protein L19 [Verrucomicrobiota bacterium]NDE62875.1 50S ribosomal protein L19 [Chlamydiota bacterium]
MNQLIEKINAAHMKADVAAFAPGDTVKVLLKITEGDKERTQVYEGTVIGRKGRGLSETFTVLRTAGGYKTQRTMFVHSPKITVEVKRRGKVRRAKLNYLEHKTGAKARVKDRIAPKAK